MRRGYAPVATILIGLLAPSVANGTNCIIPGPYCTDFASGLNLNLHGLDSSVTDQGLGAWGNNCTNYASGFPYIGIGYGDVPVDVYYEPGISSAPTGTCGTTTVITNSNGSEIVAGSITLWEKDGNGTQCPLGQVLEHELGHMYGLEQATDPACNGTIMGAQTYNTTPSFPSDTCTMLDNLWHTNQEYLNDQACYSSCVGACYHGRCDTAECFEYPNGSYSSNCYSPILIDLSGDGFRLTSARDGVRFDLNSDGRAESISWTRDGGNVLLCLDRNSNGRIDSGRELFGNYTPLQNGTRAHTGFDALAEYDGREFGGNGNGRIDPGDAVWSRLLVWADSDHDGVSQPAELSTLDGAGITSINLEYKYVGRVDKFGNAFRLKGSCVRLISGKEHRRDIYDVFFVPLTGMAATSPSVVRH